MELVYFWIEKFGDKKNQDINFSQNYNFKFELQNEGYLLTLKENDNKIPNNYFGKKISNISCIIGENGSGKTTLIRQFLKLKFYENFSHSLSSRYILIFKKNDTLEIKSNIEDKKIKIKQLHSSYNLDTTRCKYSNYKEDYIPSSLVDDYIKIKFIYFTNDFNPMSESLITNVFDISIKNKLTHRTLKEGETNITGLDFIRTLFDENMGDIAIFIMEHGDDFIKKIPYNSLKNKLMRIKNEGMLTYKVKEQFSKYAENEIYKKIYNKINIKNNNFKNKNFIEKFILNTWIYISNCIFKDIEEKRFSEKDIDKFIQREKNNSLEEWFEKQLNILEKLTNIYNSDMQKTIDNQNKFYSSLTLDYDKIKLLYKYIKEKSNSKDKLEIYYRDNKELIENIKQVNSLINLVKFYFKDGFSNGEYILIYLLKEIFNLSHNIDLNGDAEGIVFFIEEAESFIHPEWQRRLIELLEIIANNCLWLKNRRIQFILTSHTPFLVGDLPMGNIKRIKNFEIKDLEKNPFGDNLLNIFKSQFQLESLFGEFTRKKIKKYVNKLEKHENLSLDEKEEIKFLINNIEEPLIKSSLKELYEKTLSKEEKIKLLKEELKRLESEDICEN